MFTPPTESPRCRTVGKENGRNGSSGNRRKGFRRPVPAACLFGGELGQRMPWRAVTFVPMKLTAGMMSFGLKHAMMIVVMPISAGKNDSA